MAQYSAATYSLWASRCFQSSDLQSPVRLIVFARFFKDLVILASVCVTGLQIPIVLTYPAREFLRLLVAIVTTAAVFFEDAEPEFVALRTVEQKAMVVSNTRNEKQQKASWNLHNPSRVIFVIVCVWVL